MPRSKTKLKSSQKSNENQSISLDELEIYNEFFKDQIYIEDILNLIQKSDEECILRNLMILCIKSIGLVNYGNLIPQKIQSEFQVNQLLLKVYKNSLIIKQGFSSLMTKQKEFKSFKINFKIFFDQLLAQSDLKILKTIKQIGLYLIEIGLAKIRMLRASVLEIIDIIVIALFTKQQTILDAKTKENQVQELLQKKASSQIKIYISQEQVISDSLGIFMEFVESRCNDVFLDLQMKSLYILKNFITKNYQTSKILDIIGNKLQHNSNLLEKLRFVKDTLSSNPIQREDFIQKYSKTILSLTFSSDIKVSVAALELLILENRELSEYEINIITNLILQTNEISNKVAKILTNKFVFDDLISFSRHFMILGQNYNVVQKILEAFITLNIQYLTNYDEMIMILKDENEFSIFIGNLMLASASKAKDSKEFKIFMNFTNLLIKNIEVLINQFKNNSSIIEIILNQILLVEPEQLEQMISLELSQIIAENIKIIFQYTTQDNTIGSALKLGLKIARAGNIHKGIFEDCFNEIIMSTVNLIDDEINKTTMMKICQICKKFDLIEINDHELILKIKNLIKNDHDPEIHQYFISYVFQVNVWIFKQFIIESLQQQQNDVQFRTDFSFNNQIICDYIYDNQQHLFTEQFINLQNKAFGLGCETLKFIQNFSSNEYFKQEYQYIQNFLMSNLKQEQQNNYSIKCNYMFQLINEISFHLISDTHYYIIKTLLIHQEESSNQKILIEYVRKYLLMESKSLIDQFTLFNLCQKFIFEQNNSTIQFLKLVQKEYFKQKSNTQMEQKWVYFLSDTFEKLIQNQENYRCVHYLSVLFQNKSLFTKNILVKIRIFFQNIIEDHYIDQNNDNFQEIKKFLAMLERQAGIKQLTDKIEEQSIHEDPDGENECDVISLEQNRIDEQMNQENEIINQENNKPKLDKRKRNDSDKNQKQKQKMVQTKLFEK